MVFKEPFVVETGPDQSLTEELPLIAPWDCWFWGLQLPVGRVDSVVHHLNSLFIFLLPLSHSGQKRLLFPSTLPAEPD